MSSTSEATVGSSHPERDATQACRYQQFSRSVKDVSVILTTFVVFDFLTYLRCMSFMVALVPGLAMS